ncbi:MAG: YraN family protein [Alphaproteobacteria bacterium]|nr:YraN family protein [Alphaproteobacteria bacterium]OJV16085.1 MAG: hypothetical protein BGO27_03760 [Alphaproteobacteria bacterium 33-17]
MKKSYSIGLDIEKRVIKYLENKGYNILSHRYKTKYGEIDVIIENKSQNLLIACEVKYREDISDAHYAISKRQINRISDSLQQFLTENQSFAHYDLRVDAILCNNIKVRIIENITLDL